MSPEGGSDLSSALGRILVVGGGLAALAGALLLAFGDRMPRPGHLPGDIVIRKPGFTLYLPLATCALASLIATGLIYLVSLFRRS